MKKEEVVWVKCRFAKGGFPSERKFFVDAPQGGVFVGTAPSDYCFGLDGKTLTPEMEPKKMVDGLVVGVDLGETASGLHRIYLPDGEIYDLKEAQLEHNKGAPARVPVES